MSNNWLNWPGKKIAIWLGVGLLAIVLITVLAAPNNPQASGSTYSRYPDGYGAWYQFMTEQGTPVKRWQRSFSDLANSSPKLSPPASTKVGSPPESGSHPSEPTLSTLLQVHTVGTSDNLSSEETAWLTLGNRLVVLGVYTPATKATFRSYHATPAGSVQIDSRRRKTKLAQEESKLLGDAQGVIVWRRTIGQGEAIFVSTPYLAANAYQDSPGNYAFLASLVTKANHQLFVDEYLHGYRDREVIQQETAGSWVDYLAQTALLPVVLQLGVGLLVLIWASNQRFGLPQPLAQVPQNNSRVYINALAEVLRKAQSSDFVVATIGKAEQLHLQRSLGLGNTLLSPAELTTAWVNQTGRSAQDLRALCQFAAIDATTPNSPSTQETPSLSEADLLSWVEQINEIRRSLPPSSSP